MRKHPDAKLTLREAYEKHYDVTELAHSTVKWYRYVLNKWESVTDNPPIGEISNDTLAEFKKRCLDNGLGGMSINQY